MNNKGYGREKTRYEEGPCIKTSLQVVDVLNEKMGFSGGWTHQKGKYFTIVITMFTQYQDGTTDIEILHSYPKRGGRGWSKWLPVIRAVKEKGVIPEISGKFGIVKPASSKRRTVKETSNFKLTGEYTEEEFATAVERFTGVKPPKNGPNLFTEDK